ncbi:MAG: phosphotransferase [Deltaproteobacteria bacterium]|nr:phosphotransferase [Deltaproteobacteria bacterium]MBW2415778.1 phosphotransferase [Deltaproteobacteria bacterium]
MPDAGELTPERVADELLGNLRTAPACAHVSFSEPPVRITGGFETLIFGFRLSDDASPELSGRLVVRVLSEPGGVTSGRMEAAFQNAVAAAGFPAPRVVFAGGERTMGGRAFNVMERVSGHAMIEDLFADPAAGTRVADQLAEVHAQLHELPVAGVADALEAAGVPREAVSVDGQLHLVRRFGAEPALGRLGDCADWLLENRPPERGGLSVCHGDFHPGNVMVDGGRVTGVIDWSGPGIAHHEHDLAVTLVLIAVAAPALVQSAPPGMFEAFADGYLATYARHRPVDADRLRYYRALRSFRAFAHGSAARTPGIDPALVPRDQYPWAEAGLMRRLAGVLHETTGLDVPLPSGLEA